MTSYTLSPVWGAGAQLFDNSGNVLTGGKIETYEAGTTTPAVTYTNPIGSVFNSNPIIADASGRLSNEIWLPVSASYKFVLKDANNVLIATYDNIPAAPQPPIVNDASSISYEQGYTVTAGAFTVGATYRITSIGTTNFVAIGAAANVTGILFTATGVGSGTGTAEYSRTVQAKLRETVSVQDFGAVGDGVTDDTAAIQAAIATGEYLYFPKPDVFYNVASSLNITVPFEAGLYHVFGGAGSVTLNAPAYPDWFGTGIDGSTGGAAFNKAALAGTSVRLANKIYNIRDVRLISAVSIYGDGSDSRLNLVADISTATPPVFADAFLTVTNAKVAALDFHNFQLTTLTANGAVLANVFLLYNVENVSIFNVRLYNTYDNTGGVGMLRVTGPVGNDSTSSNVKIIGCNIESTEVAEGIGLTGVNGCVISNNRIYNPDDDAIGLHGALSDSSYYNGDIVITGNTVYAGSRCVLLDGYNLNINITGNLFTDIGTVTHFMFLTQNPFATVSVDSIPKKVLLSNNLFVSGSTTYEASAIGLTCGNEITISNNKISDSDQFLTAINIAPYGLISGVQLPLTNVVINGNVINNAKNGMSFTDGSSGYTPQNFTISNNVSTNILAFRILCSATPVLADNWRFFGNNMGDGSFSINWVTMPAGLFVYDDGTNNWNSAFNAENPINGLIGTWISGQSVKRVDPIVSGGFLLSGWICTANTVITTGSITSGSTALTVATAGINNGDLIKIVGAGVAGANLITTVSSGGGTVNLVLATAASTTVVAAVVNNSGTWIPVKTPV